MAGRVFYSQNSSTKNLLRALEGLSAAGERKKTRKLEKERLGMLQQQLGFQEQRVGFEESRLGIAIKEQEHRQTERIAEQTRFNTVQKYLGGDRANRIASDLTKTRLTAEHRAKVQENQQKQVQAAREGVEWSRIQAMGSELSSEWGKRKPGEYESAEHLEMRKYRSVYFMKKAGMPESQIRTKVDSIYANVKPKDELSTAERQRVTASSALPVLMRYHPKDAGNILSSFLSTGQIPELGPPVVDKDWTDIQKAYGTALQTMLRTGMLEPKEFMRGMESVGKDKTMPTDLKMTEPTVRGMSSMEATTYDQLLRSTGATPIRRALALYRARVPEKKGVVRKRLDVNPGMGTELLDLSYDEAKMLKLAFPQNRGFEIDLNVFPEHKKSKTTTTGGFEY